MTPPTRPALRYHGGKWRLAPWIIDQFPTHRVYVEPFGGGASVLLRKPRSYAEVYNDLDGEVVEFFRVLREPQSAQRLAELLRITPFSREDFNAAYEAADDPIERARRLVIRSFMGFGSDAHTDRKSGFRSNSNRSGTTPAHDWVNYPSQVAAFAERLAGVVIENRDACEVMQKHDAPTTLHYVDPPYVHETRAAMKGRGSGIYRHEVSDEDHRRMAAVLSELVGTVVLSGYDCSLYAELFGDWHRVEKTTHADGARARTEVLWINREPEPEGLFARTAV